MSARYFEDYLLNERRETSGRTITEADIVFHAGHTGDFYPHHMDAEFCKTTPFGQRIAHGTMTFAIGIGLTATVINPHAFTYGYDRLRFPKPLFINDTIHTRMTVIKIEPDEKRPQYGKVTEKCEVLNQRDEVVLACEHILLVARRPSR
jgi:acyl dehydratase